MDDSLLDDLYASIVVHGDYARVLAGLSPLFGSHAGTVVERQGSVLQFRAVSNLDPSIMADYNKHHCKSDVWVLAKGELETGVPFIGSRCIDPAVVKRTGFFADFLLPHGISDILSLRLGDDHRPMVYLTFFHPFSEVFRDQDSVLLAKVGRHIGRAHRLRGALLAHGDAGPFPLDELRLTPKEREIAALMLGGHSYAAIAESARVTRNTAHWHVRNILEKAGVRSKAQFIARFVLKGRRRDSDDA